MENKGPISQFILKHFKHFNAASLADAAEGYKKHLAENKVCMFHFKSIVFINLHQQ